MDSKGVSSLNRLQAPATQSRRRREEEDDRDRKDERQNRWQEAVQRAAGDGGGTRRAQAGPVTGAGPITTHLPPLPELLNQIQEDSPDPPSVPGDQEAALRRFRRELRTMLERHGFGILSDRKVPSSNELEAAVNAAIAKVSRDPGLPASVLETIQLLATRLKDPAQAARLLRAREHDDDDDPSDLIV